MQQATLIVTDNAYQMVMTVKKISMKQSRCIHALGCILAWAFPMKSYLHILAPLILSSWLTSSQVECGHIQ